MTTPFRGWSDAAIDFYRELTVNNNRTFWLAHKSIYDDDAW